jgi:proteic killer suppression protein
VNDQYRIEFREILVGDKTIAEMVNLTELSNHYKNT